MKTKQRLMTGLIAASLVMMSASTAFADELIIEGNLAGVSSANPGYVGLTGAGSSGGVGLLVGYELDAVPGLRLMGAYGVDGMMGSRFSGMMDYEWGRNRLMVGADYGIDLFDQRLRPLGRLTMGYSHQSLGMTVDNITYRGSDHGFVAHGSAGVELTFGRGEIDPGKALTRVSFGVNLLMGYLWQTEASFDDMRSTSAPSEPNEEDPWTRGGFDAGSMQMSGSTWSLGAVLRYSFGM